MSLEEPGRLEEERRLAYVGITRHEEAGCPYAENRRLHGSDMYNTPSRFIREIPSDLIEEVRLNGSVSRPWFLARARWLSHRRKVLISADASYIKSLVRALSPSSRAREVMPGLR